MEWINHVVASPKIRFDLCLGLNLDSSILRPELRIRGSALRYKFRPSDKRTEIAIIRKSDLISRSGRMASRDATVLTLNLAKAKEANLKLTS